MWKKLACYLTDCAGAQCTYRSYLYAFVLFFCQEVYRRWALFALLIFHSTICGIKFFFI